MKHKRTLKTIVVIIAWIGYSAILLSLANDRESVLFDMKASSRILTPLTEQQVDSLWFLYGKNKKILPEYEMQSLIALSYYPELINTTITFKYLAGPTTMAALPKFFSLFSRERKYCVLITNNPKCDCILLNEAPFNAQVGAIGHELAHIAHYETKNFVGMIQLATHYMTKKGKRSLERETDMKTINHGLGWQLYDWQYSVFDSPKATEEYKTFKKEIYMSYDEIEQAIINHTIYDSEHNHFSLAN